VREAKSQKTKATKRMATSCGFGLFFWQQFVSKLQISLTTNLPTLLTHTHLQT